MKKCLPILLMSIFIFGAVFSSAVNASYNPVVSDTASKILKANESVNKAVNQSVNKSVNQYVNNSLSMNETSTTNLTETTAEGSAAEQKARADPTVILRPVNDVITKNEDGLVELYIDNPSLNDVTLNVDARINVPSGIHVYGKDFAQTGASDTAYGTFSVPPGSTQTISIGLKGEKIGTFTVHFSGLYWSGDDKDNYNPISLSHPFVVEEVSANPEKTPSSNESVDVETKNNREEETEEGGSGSALGFGILVAGICLLGVYAIKRK